MPPRAPVLLTEFLQGAGCTRCGITVTPVAMIPDSDTSHYP